MFNEMTILKYAMAIVWVVIAIFVADVALQAVGL